MDIKRLKIQTNGICKVENPPRGHADWQEDIVANG